MIYLWNSDKTVLLQRAGYGSKGSMQGEKDVNIYHVPKGKGVVGAAAANGKYILANDTSLDKRYFSADGKIMMSELCVPVIHNNEVMGVVDSTVSKVLEAYLEENPKEAKNIVAKVILAAALRGAHLLPPIRINSALVTMSPGELPSSASDAQIACFVVTPSSTLARAAALSNSIVR